MLSDKSKDNLATLLTGLLAQYFNDSNSSTLREMVVVSACGFTPNVEKLGYNGSRQLGISNQHEYCEAKPSNIKTDSSAKTKLKLNDSGNFTDYTWNRLKKDGSS